MKKCNSNVKEDLELKWNSKFKTSKACRQKNNIHKKNKNKKIKRKKCKVNKKSMNLNDG